MDYSIALCQLPLVREARGAAIRCPQDAYEACRDMARLAQESFQVLMLDTRCRIINRVLVTLGIVNAALVHPREVFRAAIRDNATDIILVHNHPSGDPSPSTEDLRITRQLIEAGKVIDISVRDHVIIGREEDGHPGFLSLREKGVCAFN